MNEPRKAGKHERAATLATLIVTHLFRNPAYQPDCVTCQHIRTGVWPR